MTAEREHVDVLVIGAGLSGVGAGCHLRREHPERSFAILEAREAMGGTWDLFRYPGIRSDSDMFTLGYSFAPWKDPQAFADGPSILAYIHETAREYRVDEEIRYGHRVLRASWSSAEARWTVEVEREGEVVELTCDFLLGCTGYYRYDRGYTPELPGIERFGGEVIHPQLWPEDLAYAGKRVVVVGSGATAVTLVPAMARDAEHVTMLQRSPSYIIPRPGRDEIAAKLMRVLPAKATYWVMRWVNWSLAMLSFVVSRRRPDFAKRLFRRIVTAQLPAGYDVAKHFSPRYNPWEQRLCVAPDGDLFDVLGDGSASIATDTIETFTESGIKLASGEELEADIVITATGLDLIPLGGVTLEVNGAAVDVSERLMYRGMMLSGVPNLAVALGYPNASWTLKVDITLEYVCRLLSYMDARGYAEVVAVNDDPTVTPQPVLDLSSGYILRALEIFPNQGSKVPWRLHQNWARDKFSLRFASFDDRALHFSRAPVAAPAEVPQPA
ncbi:MAG: monooxygenase [Solirubrobacterales bacterium]|nr:monooxygenase [Solirubrobacterales bacterium]